MTSTALFDAAVAPLSSTSLSGLMSFSFMLCSCNFNLFPEKELLAKCQAIQFWCRITKRFPHRSEDSLRTSFVVLFRKNEQEETKNVLIS